MKTEIVQEFDEALWKEGVAAGAFSGERDPDGVWYTLKADGEKVAIAAATQGPADLVNVSYYVHPDHRGLGYGTKIASRVTDLHEKATFTIFKDNEASIKVALAALRNKFSMTMGHNVVRLTKTAGKFKEGLGLGAIVLGSTGLLYGAAKLSDRIHEARRAKLRQTISSGDLPAYDPVAFEKDLADHWKRYKKAADANKVEEEPEKPKMKKSAAIIDPVKEKKDDRPWWKKGPPLVSYVDDIGMITKGLRKNGPAIAETAIKAADARELLKQAISSQTAERALQSRFIQSRLKGISSPQALMRRVVSAAEVVAKKPTTELSPETRKKILSTTRFVKMNIKDDKGGEIYKKIRSAELTSSHQMELDMRKKAVDPAIEKGRKALHKMVRPMAPLYKTKGAEGWDVLTDAMLSDSQSTGA